MGYLLNELLPHFATISYNFRHRFAEDTIEKVFTWILYETQKSHLMAVQAVEQFPEIKIVTMDAGYKTPWICKRVIDDRRLPSLPYKRPMTKAGFHEWYKYVCDEYLDIVICPEYKSLLYSTTNRDGYREYKSLNYQCGNCLARNLCAESRSCQKVVTRHIWADYIERTEDIRHSPEGKGSYKLQSQTIERVFANAKEKYGMRYTPYRGLKRVSMWIRLKFAAMSLKSWRCGGGKRTIFH